MDCVIKEITTDFIGKMIYNEMITVLAYNPSKIMVLEFSTAAPIMEKDLGIEPFSCELQLLPHIE